MDELNVQTVDQYKKILHEIHTIAEKCKRDPATIALVAVTKGRSLDQIHAAYEGGCRDFGENKVQESLQKISDFPYKTNCHLIGTLQTNKVRKVIGKFHLIHSVDNYQLAKKIAAASEEVGFVTSVLLQVNTSKESSKHGFSPEELMGGFTSISELKGIQIKGLMTMAPLIDDENAIRKCFRNLRLLKDKINSAFGQQINDLSMGMSQDYHIAIEEGATLLRIGTAIFGER